MTQFPLADRAILQIEALGSRLWPPSPHPQAAALRAVRRFLSGLPPRTREPLVLLDLHERPWLVWFDGGARVAFGATKDPMEYRYDVTRGGKVVVTGSGSADLPPPSALVCLVGADAPRASNDDRNRLTVI